MSLIVSSPFSAFSLCLHLSHSIFAADRKIHEPTGPAASTADVFVLCNLFGRFVSSIVSVGTRNWPAITLPLQWPCVICVKKKIKRFTRIDRMHKLHSGSEFAFCIHPIQHIRFFFCFFCFPHSLFVFSRAEIDTCCYIRCFSFTSSKCVFFFFFFFNFYIFRFCVLMFDSFPACWFVDFHKFVRSIFEQQLRCGACVRTSHTFCLFVRWKKNIWKSPSEKKNCRHIIRNIGWHPTTWKKEIADLVETWLTFSSTCVRCHPTDSGTK